jgi:hypothetical protein
VAGKNWNGKQHNSRNRAAALFLRGIKEKKGSSDLALFFCVKSRGELNAVASGWAPERAQEGARHARCRQHRRASRRGLAEVILSPLVVGTLFGVETLAGLLSGVLVSSVKVAISTNIRDGPGRVRGHRMRQVAVGW